MKKITIDLPEARQIEINGHVFTLQKSDVEVLDRALDMLEKAQRFVAPEPGADEATKYTIPAMRETVNAIKSAIAYIDQILGEGATAKIFAGRSVSMSDSISALMRICAAIFKDSKADSEESTQAG